MKHFPLILCLLFSIIVTSQVSKNDKILELSKIINIETLENTLKSEYAKGSFKDHDDFLFKTKDAFHKALAQKKYDKALSIYNMLGTEYNLDLTVDSTLVYKSQIEPFIKIIKNDAQLGRYFEVEGYTLYFQGDTKKAVPVFDKALKYLEKVNDSASTSWSRAHFYSGYIASFGDGFKLGFNHLNQALQLARYQKNYNQQRLVRSVLATLYSKAYLFKEAAAEREEVIKLALKTERKGAIAIAYMNYSSDEENQGNHEKSYQYLLKAKTFTDPEDQSATSYFLSIYLLDHYTTNNFSKDSISNEFGTLNKLYPKFKGNDYYDIFYNDCLAKIAFSKNNFNEAERLGIQNLKQAQEYGDTQLIEWMHETLEKIYKAQGNETKADFHTKEIAISEAATKQSAIKDQLTYYQTIYETEKRDLTIKARDTSIALLDERDKVKNQWLLFGGLGFLAIFGFVITIRSRNFAKRKQRMQESFTQDLLKTQENERSRIAKELHDSVGQKLLILKNSLLSNENKEAKEIDMVGETIKEVREMSHNLHPFQFEKLGLMTSLKNMVATFQKNSNVFYSEDIESTNSGIAKEKEIYVFRILQECITNVEKHANATACNLSCEENKNQLVFILKDNGNGFKIGPNNAAFEGLGMKTIKERGQFIEADLDIISAPEKGTTITIKIPKK